MLSVIPPSPLSYLSTPYNLLLYSPHLPPYPPPELYSHPSIEILILPPPSASALAHL